MPKGEGTKIVRRPTCFNIDVTVEREFRSSCYLRGDKPAAVVEELLKKHIAGNRKPTAPETKKGGKK